MMNAESMPVSGFCHPFGMICGVTRVRGYRCAQPPATIYHPSGMGLSSPEGWQNVAGGRRPPETNHTTNRIPEGCQKGCN